MRDTNIFCTRVEPKMILHVQNYGFIDGPYPTNTLKKMMMVIFETNFVHYGRTHREAQLLNKISEPQIKQTMD